MHCSEVDANGSSSLPTASHTHALQHYAADRNGCRLLRISMLKKISPTCGSLHIVVGRSFARPRSKGLGIQWIQSTHRTITVAMRSFRLKMVSNAFKRFSKCFHPLPVIEQAERGERRVWRTVRTTLGHLVRLVGKSAGQCARRPCQHPPNDSQK